MKKVLPYLLLTLIVSAVIGCAKTEESDPSAGAKKTTETTETTETK
ncbi:MAG: hypothetical protein ACOYON_16245 [Fimbriimonas sp.]